ncbi:trehalase family glycosidase [Evansella sp. AB-P1]|uniref:MGH1-like glycoside hydrolase domain-containing protein n=1 Tax=Evansella sp. AB-P1 TaxID=3037653 RepID=UPI00241E8F74|nr:trehalase family glycosidase [Evansella sp. AB-P1]MDG5787078.1 trehalase family glycosidase [Evansella sp. AB-P1]
MSKFPGKLAWQQVLHYTEQLHKDCTYPPETPFPYPWENIGSGYCYGPAFGHWDIVHATLDAIHTRKEHAKNQLLNNFHNQSIDGFLPGVIYKSNNEVNWSSVQTHPPVWPIAVEDYMNKYDDTSILLPSYEAIKKQIAWFENNRNAEEEGFYYTDILNNLWESGVDDGIRFKEIATGKFPCVDATSHVYLLYSYAEKWAIKLNDLENSSIFEGKAKALKEYIQTTLFDEETGFFHDSWAVGKPHQRHLAFEGIWAIVVGAATDSQAQLVIDKNLLNPNRFFTDHPMPTVAINDPDFELRMWRGPSWNSMTYWAARGCMKYERKDAAMAILEKALDATSEQFERTGTIWEFYHPFLGEQTEVKRKPYTEFNQPCKDYLGHNPLIAMAYLWEKCK